MSNPRQFLCITGLLLVLAACASSGSSGSRERNPPAAPVPGGAMDASYDWHGLVLMPFGMLLKESPIPLHEVLLFHDAASRADVERNRDCYALEGSAPRFVGQQPDHYLLCFEHDHLNRIEASIRLDGADAPQRFARVCALWLKGAAPTAGIGDTCAGRDGGIEFNAQLGPVTDAAASLSMTLSGAAPSEPDHVAAHEQ